MFTVTYDVIAAGFSNITIIEDSTISNGSTGKQVIHSTISSTYGTPTVKPDFTIKADPTDFSMTLAASHNVTESVTITLTSIDNFTGTATFSAKATLQVSVSPTQVFLPINGTAETTLTVSASNTTTSTVYYITVNATIGSTSHSKILSALVTPIPDFVMSVLPSLLKIHATNSGSSVITIDTQSGYSGSVHLKMDVPSVPGLTASLGATDLTISPKQPATTIFGIRIPASAYPFKYLINITASSSQSTHQPFTITVRPPSPDFDFQVAASSYVVQAGKSLTVTLNTTSLNYFKGQLFFLASSFSGIKSTFTRSSLALDYGPSYPTNVDYGNSSSSRMTITTDAFLSPGNHNINVTALGTTFLGVPVNHSIILTVTVIPIPAQRVILGLPPVTYFGVIGALWAGLFGFAIREIRKPKQKRFLD